MEIWDSPVLTTGWQESLATCCDCSYFCRNGKIHLQIFMGLLTDFNVGTKYKK
jgi:hypothetical protein